MFFVEGNGECHYVQQELIIGRLGDIVPDNPSISRRHCRLYLSESGLFLEDLGSKYGTFCNHSRLTQPVNCKDGDIVTLGLCPTEYRILKPKIACSGLTPIRKRDLFANYPNVRFTNTVTHCSHLLVDHLSITLKVVLALALAKPIVNHDWLVALSKGQLNDPNLYLPHISDSNWSSTQFMVNSNRPSLFAAHFFVYTNTDQNISSMLEIIRAAGGVVCHLDEYTSSERHVSVLGSSEDLEKTSLDDIVRCLLLVDASGLKKVDIHRFRRFTTPSKTPPTSEEHAQAVVLNVFEDPIPVDIQKHPSRIIYHHDLIGGQDQDKSQSESKPPIAKVKPQMAPYKQDSIFRRQETCQGDAQIDSDADFKHPFHEPLRNVENLVAKNGPTSNKAFLLKGKNKSTIKDIVTAIGEGIDTAKPKAHLERANPIDRINADTLTELKRDFGSKEPFEVVSVALKQPPSSPLTAQRKIFAAKTGNKPSTNRLCTQVLSPKMKVFKKQRILLAPQIISTTLR